MPLGLLSQPEGIPPKGLSFFYQAGWVQVTTLEELLSTLKLIPKNDGSNVMIKLCVLRDTLSKESYWRICSR